MKSALILFLFPLFLIGVFGDDVESVSVMEGDSVTLHTDIKINNDEMIEWIHKDISFAKVNRGKTGKILVTVNETVKSRVQLDNQTGDLKIMKIKVSDSGRYEPMIDDEPLQGVKVFSLSVSGVGAVKSVSVMKGDSVTLNSGTNIQTDNVIEWRFGDQNSPIAENNRKTGIFSTSDGPDGRFRHRLQLDYLTGSLTISKIGTENSGFYEAGIRKSRHTVHQSYSVTVSGEMKSALLVKEGDSVILHTGLTEIQTDDFMQWMFEDTVIAKIIKADDQFPTSDGPDGRFRDRLKLNKKTGSLTITNTRNTDSGLYELKIIIIRFTINKRSTVTVSGEKSALSVIKGESVTLNSDLTEIQTDDLMLWMFGETVLAEIYKADNRFSPSDDRLKLDHQTGSLTITDTRNTDSGLYELKISSSRRTVHKRFTVNVSGLSTGDIAGIVVAVLLLVCVAAAAAAGVIYHRHKNFKLKERIYTRRVFEGETFTLNPDVKVHKDDKLLWMFGDSCIAVRESAVPRFTVHHDRDGRFRDRLELDHQTGSLIITNTRTTHTGVYELLIIRSGKTLIKRFSVSVFLQIEQKIKSGNKGGSVTLETGVTDIQKDDQIQWKFGLHTLLAEMTREDKIISPLAAKSLKDRLELDHQTGSLTINNIRPTDAGIYMLDKIEGGNITTILFRVEVSDPTDDRNNPEEKSMRKEVVPRPRSLTYFWRNKDRNNPEEVPMRNKDVP